MYLNACRYVQVRRLSQTWERPGNRGPQLTLILNEERQGFVPYPFRYTLLTV